MEKLLMRNGIYGWWEMGNVADEKWELCMAGRQSPGTVARGLRYLGCSEKPWQILAPAVTFSQVHYMGDKRLEAAYQIWEPTFIRGIKCFLLLPNCWHPCSPEPAWQEVPGNMSGRGWTRLGEQTTTCSTQPKIQQAGMALHWVV